VSVRILGSNGKRLPKILASFLNRFGSGRALDGSTKGFDALFDAFRFLVVVSIGVLVPEEKR